MSEEQEKIQKYIIKSTPYGELREVIYDLEKLAPFNSNSAPIALAIEEYNEDHLALLPVKSPLQPFFPLMHCSRVEPGRYLDQGNKKIYRVDHLKLEVVSVEEASVELEESVEELLGHLSLAASKYAEKYYKEPYGSQGRCLTMQSSWTRGRSRWTSTWASPARTWS